MTQYTESISIYYFLVCFSGSNEGAREQTEFNHYVRVEIGGTMRRDQPCEVP